MPCPYASSICYLTLRPVIEHKHLGQMWTEDRTKGFVRGVGQIGVTVGSAAKGDKEAVRVAVRPALDTYIGAPLKAVDGVDLAGESAKRVFNGFDLIGRSLFFKLEEDNVAEQLVSSHG